MREGTGIRITRAEASAGRRLPHSTEIERSLLGGLLLDPSQLPDVRELLTAEDLHRPQHQALLQLLIELAEVRGGYDFQLVLDEVSQRPEPEHYGGVAYIVALPNACPSVESVKLYAEKLRAYSVRRRLILAAWSIIDRASAGEDEIGTLVAEAEKSVFEVSQGTESRDWFGLAEVLREQLEVIEDRQALFEEARRTGTSVVVTGVTTGFADLDSRLAGLQKTDLIILAARPAMGKTALALNLALNAAQKGGAAVGVFSLEMSRQQLVTRLLTAEAQVDASKVRIGDLNREDFDRLHTAAEALQRLSLYIDDAPGLTMPALRSKARRLKAEHPELGLLIIDYLQLMQGSGNAKESREQVISNISRGLKILAKELQIPVIALSQLNRSLEARTDKRPMMSDLRESGAIEQDADIILFIYRDEVYNPESPDKGIAEVIIAKQRSGPIGTVKLAFLGQFTLFRNYADPETVPDGYC